MAAALTERNVKLGVYMCVWGGVYVGVGGPLDSGHSEGATVRVGCLSRINGLNRSAAVIQTRFSWSREDLEKVRAGGGGAEVGRNEVRLYSSSGV